MHLATKGFDVLGWSIEDEVVTSINEYNKHPRFHSHIQLSSVFRATNDLSEVLTRDLLVLAVPSSAISEVFPKLVSRRSPLVVSAIKGLDSKTLLTPLQALKHFGIEHSGAAVLSGPSFARDVVRGLPCGLVSASSNESVARSIADIFSNDAMKVYISTDPLGVELGGIVKNVVALAAGVCDGLELGDSARAGLITRGLAEMIRLARAMGAQLETLAGLSGLGDLVMTATCDTSRNRTVGLELGRGKKLPDILRELGSVAEGVETTPLVLELARKFNVEMPISQS
jgi:glycerol-3-phosphate dehydrogenase (NAD(P)+)